MECNKEEAVRAKSLAETKMQNKDFTGARKMALKAQQLYTELDKISHILIICDVHCAAERKILGTEMDWYGILQIEKTADEAIIKKQYRKFALLLHPDKNEFPGAEAAFKLIGEAQRVLLDKGLRSLHDMKCRNPLSKPAPKPSYSSSSGAQNGFRGSVNGSSYQQQRPQQPTTQSGVVNGRPTFWTACPFCLSKFQYFRDIINKSVRCQTCTKPFVAYEKSAQAMPSVRTTQGMPSVRTTQGMPSVRTTQGMPSVHTMQGMPSVRTTTQGMPTVSSFSQPVFNQPKDAPQDPSKSEVGSQGNTSKVHSKLESRKKPTAAEVSSGKANGKRPRKKEMDFIVSSDSESSSSDEEPMMEDVELGSYKERPRRSVRSKHQVSYNENKSDDEESKTPQKKAKGNVSAEEHMQSSGEAIAGENNNLNAEDLMNEDDKTRNVEEKQKIDDNGCMRSSEVQEDSPSDTDSVLPSVCYECPDSEFNDFDTKRSAKLFKAGQIWAIYDEFNGMPRYYARINRVFPGGLKFKLTWLEVEPYDEDEKEWAGAGLPVSCGKFKLGSSIDAGELNLFSHQVEWEKGNHQHAYKIVPRQGEIWALFKNWDINWKSQTGGAANREIEYDFVEILSNFSENAGVSVLYLGKLKGFVSLFCRISNKPVQIKPTELLRFSHQVPSFTMTGEERDGVPKGSFELDPASLPEKLEEIDVPKNLEGQNGDSLPEEVCSESSSEEVSEVASTNDPQAEINGEQEVLPNEFFDFDDEKAVEKFEKGQIWSMYCDEDSLPKYYAQVINVDKGQELKINVKWLKPAQLPSGTIEWADSEMPISCGRFRVEKRKAEEAEYDNVNSFSHLVTAESVNRGRTREYNILPAKNEVWALYRDWTHTLKISDLKTCEYDVVEVLERNDLHIRVTHLERVKGYNAVFRAAANKESTGREVKMSELLRFSHQIPAVRLTKKHGNGSLSGYWELDSAALPARFFT